MMMLGDAGQNIISFVAHGAKVEVHRHHCFQILLSINSTFDCTIGGLAYKDKTGFLINQDIPHSCSAQAASVFIYFIDAESYYGWLLREMLAGENFIDLEAFFTRQQCETYFTNVLIVRDHVSLTNAALESGFADQAHFCRTFKRMFGINAKTLLKNSRYVQFLNPLT